MRIERHSHAAHHQEESSPFTFLPTAILTFGALPFLAQNASAAVYQRMSAAGLEPALDRSKRILSPCPTPSTPKETQHYQGLHLFRALQCAAIRGK